MTGGEARAGDVAIVGMAGRFPGAPDVASFWRNLRDGVECIRFFTPDELAAAGVDPALARDPSYVPAHGWLEGIELFDAAFFGVGPREAEVTDPQVRAFLEVAWEALEDAGIDPARAPGAIGVVAGASNDAYVIDNLLRRPDVIEAVGSVQTALGNHADFLATRVAYELDLSGPALTVQTACSTSLVAVHLACQSLLSGESDVMLAGGACVSALRKRGYLHVPGGTSSSDGHVRAFDARADGMLGGNGVAAVVLRRLADALAAGDTIRAVIRGTAINNDGSGKVSFTAPSVDGQARVIQDALDVSGVDPRTIGMLEAHGTGTPLGDPIEVRALTQAWRTRTDARAYCALGSAKTNVGHLDIAAGVTGLIKAALALERGAIPPSLHFERPNPELDLAASPFFVNTALRPWPAGDAPRRAAVSSFGMGGTNAHAVLEEAPAARPGDPPRRFELLPLGARSEEALGRVAARLARALEAADAPALADAAHTLQEGRAALAVRRAVVVAAGGSAAAALDALDARRATPVRRARPRRPVAFLLSGQGAQHANMARGLLDEPAFRATLERCAALLDPLLDDGPLLERLYPAPGAEEEAARALERTQLTQPALFAVELALAALWRSYGVEPESLLGHSVGELAAAVLAEVLSLEDGCRLVAARGRLIGALPAGGAMLAVHAEAEAVAPLCTPALAIAAHNAPGLVVVSGDATELAALEARLEAQGVGARRLRTSHAFHSPRMDPVLDAFRAEVERVASWQAPRIPIVSCTTGRWLSDDDARDPAYWVRHLREPVRFADGVATLARDPGRVLLEVGPGETLASLARLGAPPGTVVVASARHAQDERDDLEVLTRALGELWSAGVEIDWAGYRGGRRRRRVPLPTYPFERERFWIDPPRAGATPAAETGRRADVADWFAVPSWRQAPPVLARAHATDPAAPWLLLADAGGVGARLALALERRGLRALLVRPGPAFAEDATGFTIAPDDDEHAVRLLDALERRGARPGALVHLWSLDAELEPGQEVALAFASLVALGRALAERPRERPLPVVAVTRGVHGVPDGRARAPAGALVLGPLRALAAEARGLLAKAVDLPGARAPSDLELERLADEVQADAREREVALAGDARWVLGVEPVRLPAAPEGAAQAGGATGRAVPLRAGGTFLVTGGLGGLGLAFAHELARRTRGNLVLLAARALPDDPDAWLAAHPEHDPQSVRLRGVRALEALGARVLTAAAPVEDAAAMARVVALARERFGAIHGVVHAAGRAGSGLLATKTRADAQRVLAPKVAGTRVLHALFPDGALDFLLLVSSIATAPGVAAGVDYASANAFLDAYARSRAGGRTRVCAWGWDAWRDVGLAAPAPGVERARYERALRLAIAPDDGREAFARLLAAGLPHAWVSPVALAGRDDLASARPREPAAADAPEAPAPPAREGAPRPALATAFAEPQGATERAVAALWGELLGVAPIGRHDGFFELGGSSLVLMQLNVRLRALFGVSLSVRELFESARVADLAGRVDAIRALAAPAAHGAAEEVEEFTL